MNRKSKLPPLFVLLLGVILLLVEDSTAKSVGCFLIGLGGVGFLFGGNEK